MVIVPTNVSALALAGILIIAEVNPAKHARVGDIVDDGPEIGVLDDDARRIGMRHGDRMTAAAVGSLENLASRTASRPMCRGVAWEAWRGDVRSERTRGRARVAIFVAARDRGHGTPGSVEILALEHGDVGVAQRHVHHRGGACGKADVVVASARNLP
ncbi:MAG: hypothetical protein ABR568_19030 [Pyrinomonadaceae bacterium]